MTIARTRELSIGDADVISVLTHELRSPLSALELGIGLLREDGAHAQDASTLLDSIERNVIALRLVVDNFSDLAAIETGRLVPRLEAVAAFDAVADAVRRIAPFVIARGQAVRLLVDDAETELFCDRRLFEHVLMNLLTNATKYGRVGDLIEVAVVADDNLTKVSVTDHGIGVPPDDIPRIFGRYARGSDPRAAAAGGTGLGLTLVRALVRLQGGDVAVHSVPDRVTTFSVRLPVRSFALRRIG